MLFDPKESIDFNGNTGPFIQYTYARICSIVRKAEADFNHKVTDSVPMDVELNAKEKEIIKNISAFASVIKEAGKNYSPSIIANYAYNLAKNFNGFYQECSILKQEEATIRHMRVCLAYFTGQVIKTAMMLLGIDVPKRM